MNSPYLRSETFIFRNIRNYGPKHLFSAVFRTPGALAVLRVYNAGGSASRKRIKHKKEQTSKPKTKGITNRVMRTYPLVQPELIGRTSLTTGNEKERTQRTLD